MSRRDLSQPSFVDAMVRGCGKGGGFLDRIEQAFDWSAFEALLSPIHASTRGAPGYPPLVMFKILLLQQWHTLSDPGAEEAVRDRLSFRRFSRIAAGDRDAGPRFDLAFPPDDRQARPFGALLCETNRQLDALGLIVKRGTLVDATLIEAAVKKPPYGSGGMNPRDPDARVTMKRRKAHFGCKAHLAVDEGSGLVRQAEMTSANVHDSRLAEALIQGDEQGYFADKAYSQPSVARGARTARTGRRRGVARSAPPSARRLAEAPQFLVVEHPLRRRARPRHDEARVRPKPRPLSRARPQRLPSPVRRHRHDHETGAGAHGAKLRDPSPANPRAGVPQGHRTSPAGSEDARNPHLPAPSPRKSGHPYQKPQLCEALVKLIFCFSAINCRLLQR